MVKKVLTWAAIVLVVYNPATNPTAAAINAALNRS
jgi:hypothetical protein